MTVWSLKTLFYEESHSIAKDLASVRCSIEHSTTKGNASEKVWSNLLTKYLPERYKVTSGFVADSNNEFSEQIDILIFDRQYSPFIFTKAGCNIIPAESVYAVFEVKQDVSPRQINYARKKIASVRKLYRTSKKVVHAGGEIPKPKPPNHILGGILALSSNFNESEKKQEKFENSLFGALNGHNENDRIDLGCIADYGYFNWDKEAEQSAGDYAMDYEIHSLDKPVMKFLLKLIADLQNLGTVPVIDVDAYAKLID